MSPWHVEEDHPQCPASKPFGVVKDDDGDLEGCHATRDEANDQLAALYASEGRAMTTTTTNAVQVSTSGAAWHPTMASSVAVAKGKPSLEAKQFGRVDIDIKAAKDAGTFEAVLSAPTEDRDGEIVDGKAFDPLPEHISIDIDHAMTVAGTVGSGRPFYDGDTLKIEGTFASTPLAQEVRALVTEGHVRKMSVAFMNAQRDEAEDGTIHIRKAELLNAAIVAIPSNREASILAAKALSKAASLQQIHDLSAAAGAVCKHAAAEAHKTSTTTKPADEAAAPAAASLPAEVLVELALADLVLADLT